MITLIYRKSSTMQSRLHRTWFDLVVAGTKSVEGRPRKEEERNLKVGDMITFIARNADGTESKDMVTIKVTKLVLYSTFEQMLSTEGVNHVLPGITSVTEGVTMYHSFPKYAQLEKEWGVVAIHMEVMNE